MRAIAIETIEDLVEEHYVELELTRTIATRMKATATLALACTTALVFAVATVQARPTRTAGSQSAAAALSDCTIVISGAPWMQLHVADSLTRRVGQTI
jgi:hypothetical protein